MNQIELNSNELTSLEMKKPVFTDKVANVTSLAKDTVPSLATGLASSAIVNALDKKNALGEQGDLLALKGQCCNPPLNPKVALSNSFIISAAERRDFQTDCGLDVICGLSFVIVVFEFFTVLHCLSNGEHRRGFPQNRPT